MSDAGGAPLGRDNTGVLLIRVWLEAPSELRARITHRTDVTSSAESVTFASSAEDIHTAVTDWLRDFLDEQSR